MQWRKLRESDLASCLRAHPEIMDGWTEARGLEALRLIMESPSFAGVVIETAVLNGSPTLVGSGASVFVKEEFALSELSRPRAGIVQRILTAQLSANPVVLSRTEIATANGTAGLNAVTLWGRWRSGITSSDTINEIRLQLANSYAHLHAGYFFKRILFEIRDSTDRSLAADTKLCRLLDYTPAEFDASLTRLGLAVVELAEVNAIAGSVIGRHFNQNRPILALSAPDQEMLLAVLEDDLQDSDLASLLKISLPAIKRRWAALYSRVEASNPSFFHSNLEALVAERKEGARGLEKRRRILHFVRNHPEELRPFNSQAR
jgi:hypothetical protein